MTGFCAHHSRRVFHPGLRLLLTLHQLLALKISSSLRQHGLTLVTLFLWLRVLLPAVPPSVLVARERANQQPYTPRPFVPGLSGDYRSTQHSEQSQQKLYLQETPAGLLFDLYAHEPHPKRDLTARHSGNARKVAEGVFAAEWASESEDGEPTPAWFYITVEPSGKVEVTIRGTVARNPPFHTERNLEGTYQKVGPEAEDLNEVGVTAVEILLGKRRSTAALAPTIETCHKAAELLGGGHSLALVLFHQRTNAASFAVDICSAKQGNEYALQTVLMTLGGVRSATAIDPGFALEVYAAAKRRNPNLLGIYEEPPSESSPSLSRELALIKLAAECPPLDFDAFLQTHGISLSSLDASPYALWELAEQAALGRRFGKPNAEMAFQLVLRCGGSFEERAIAIERSHSAWKSPGKLRFNVAACLQPTKYQEYLKHRGNSSTPALALGDLRKEIRDPSAQALLDKAYEAQANFISETARIFCGDEGFHTWELNSTAYQRRSMQQYVETVRTVLTGFKPKRRTSSESADARLNAKYKLAMEGLADLEAIPEMDAESGAKNRFFYRNVDSLKKVQRMWLPMRDKSAQLFNALSPTVSLEDWKEWLTEIRTRELPAFKRTVPPQ